MLMNAGLAFLNLVMPNNAKGWNMIQLILFTIAAVLVILAFAWGFKAFKDIWECLC